MYKFIKITADGWDSFESTPSLGDEHHVQFPAAATPLARRLQMTLFFDEPSTVTLTNPAFEQRMLPGQTSLDLAITAYGAGALLIERPAVEGARRICLSPAGAPRRWSREIVRLAPGQQVAASDGALLVLLSGFALLDGVEMHTGDHVMSGAITASSEVRLLKARLL